MEELCLVHKVNRGVRAGLFIYKTFSLSAVFPSLAFGSLPSFRKETDFGRNVLCARLPFFLGENGDRFIITALGGGQGGREKKFQPARQCLFFFKGQHCHKQLWCHSVPSPGSSLSLCRIALAGGGTVKFQHLPHIPHPPTPHAAKLLRAITTAPLPFASPPPFPQPPRGSAAEPMEDCRERDTERLTPAGPGAFCVLRSFSAPGTNTAREPAPCRHTRIHAYSRAVSIHILAHRPLLPPELPESPSGASDRRVPPTRARAGREERRAGPTAARLPAPVEAARVGRGAEPKFRKRRGVGSLY